MIWEGGCRVAVTVCWRVLLVRDCSQREEDLGTSGQGVVELEVIVIAVSSDE